MKKDKKLPKLNQSDAVQNPLKNRVQRLSKPKTRMSIDEFFYKLKARPEGRIWFLLYANCYYVGSETIRLAEKTSVFIYELIFFIWRYILLDSVRATLRWIKKVTVDSFKEQHLENKNWLESKKAELQAIKNEIEANEFNESQLSLVSSDKRGSLRLYEAIEAEIVTKKRKIVFVRILPLASLVFLFLVLFTVSRFNIALQVTYAGKTLGYIANEQVYDAAVSNIEDLVMGVSTRYNFTETPNYTIAFILKSQLQTPAQFSDTLLKAVMGDEVNTGCGVYINGQFTIAVTDEKQVKDYVQSLLTPYKQRNPTGDISFYDTITYKSGMYPTTKIVAFNQASALLSGTNVTTTQYTFAKGDTPTTIASKLGISVASFTKYNNITTASIAPGTVLTVKVPRAFLRVKETVKTKYNVTLPFTTVIKNNSNQMQGWSTVTTKGKAGLKTVSVNLFYVDGVNVGQEITSSVVVQNPVNQVTQIGTLTAQKTVKAVSFNGVTVTGKFMFPVPGAYISCGWNGYPGHNGDDLAAPYGTNIYAADGGIVVGVYHWNYSYGLHVVIDHGNGYQTTYNHMSKILVTAGQKVSKGTLIGKVGETGRAYGNHCHFEIIYNGERIDPTPYIVSGKSAK